MPLRARGNQYKDTDGQAKSIICDNGRRLFA